MGIYVIIVGMLACPKKMMWISNCHLLAAGEAEERRNPGTKVGIRLFAGMLLAWRK
jgi:hypothetical protein